MSDSAMHTLTRLTSTVQAISGARSGLTEYRSIGSFVNVHVFFLYFSLVRFITRSLITFTYFLTPRPGGGAVENVGARRGTDGTHPDPPRLGPRAPRPRGAGARPTEVRDRGGMHLNTVFSNETAPALSPRGGGGRCYGPDA